MKTEVEVKQTGVFRDDRLRITHISYSTTLPLSIEPAMALEIIDNDIIQKHLKHIGEGNRPIGKLAGLVEDKAQQRYCFSISGQLKRTDEEFTVEVDVPI